jgi:hypothetical protein
VRAHRRKKGDSERSLASIFLSTLLSQRPHKFRIFDVFPFPRNLKHVIIIIVIQDVSVGNVPKKIAKVYHLKLLKRGNQGDSSRSFKNV